MADQIENLRQADLAKLPFFTGTKADTFTCEQWIARVQRAKDTSGWDDAHTMTYVLNALRGFAFAWTRSINRSNKVDINNWNSFKTGLLNAFSVIRTSRTTTINLTSLLQGTSERVTEYYIRVVDAVNDIEAMKKLNTQRLPADPWQQAAAIPEFMALGVAVRAKILMDLVDFGIQDSLDYVSLNLFVSGLKPHIREEVMRQAPKTLDDAFDLAVQSEKINYAPTRTNGTTALPVMPVDQHNMLPPAEDNEADLLAALEDMEADNENRVAAIKLKLNKFRRNGQSSGNRSAASKNSNKSSSGTKKPNPDKDVKCRYCNKMGHYQLVCNSRKRDGAPMVANDGTPYTSRPNAAMDMSGMAQAAAPLQYAPPGPPPGSGQVVYQAPYHMGYYQNPAPVFQ
jgi:hypothetical protein